MQIKQGQTLVDVAVQAVGDAEKTVQIALGAGIRLSDNLSVAQNINVPVAAIDKTATVEIMNQPSNQPASDDGTEIPEGIEFWRIGIDFKVSQP